MPLDLPITASVAVRDFDLATADAEFSDLQGYDALWLLVRLHGEPVGLLTTPLTQSSLCRQELQQLVFERLGADLSKRLVARALMCSEPSAEALRRALREPPPAFTGTWPKVTVAVCTRDRPEDLERCIRALLMLDYPNLDLLIVDNAPRSDASKQVAAKFPSARYVLEARPGLDWARNRAIAEAQGEIIAYVDDDVVVDKSWARAIARVFVEHSEVMAVTGLVIPFELSTPAQIQFERTGGFIRGFQRDFYGVNLPAEERAAVRYGGTGRFGTGANMAYRRCVFERIGNFDPALDVGTVTNGGGDIEMFFRVLKGGFTLAYEPNAIVRHRHRSDFAALHKQIKGNGEGYCSYLTRSAQHFPDERLALVRSGVWWLMFWNGRRIASHTLRRRPLDRKLVALECTASLRSLGAYRRARGRALTLSNGEAMEDTLQEPRQPAGEISPRAVAVRRCDVAELRPIEDVEHYPATRVYVYWHDRILGHVDIENLYNRISLTRLSDAIAAWLWQPIIEIATDQPAKDAITALTAASTVEKKIAAAARLAASVSVSIVVPTRDNPDDLRRCLRSLVALRSERGVEVIVVDNHPASGKTAPVVRELPQVKLTHETRRGLSRARNQGISQAAGEIIVCIDDDVIVEADWLERLVAPFDRSNVQCVTGNVLPISLDTQPQQLFERCGGLSRGYTPREVDGAWFRSLDCAVPTWTLGTTTNAAFRAEVLRDPAIAVQCEALGDNYLFYKILEQDYHLVYEPSAIVWHRHRDTMPALREHLFAKGKGDVAYQLHTLFSDRDTRALRRLVGQLPARHTKQLALGMYQQLWGTNDYPFSLLMLELAGNLLGPVKLLQSHIRTQRLGRSALL